MSELWSRKPSESTEIEQPTTWRKSSYSGSQSECVEVGGTSDFVGVRDSKDRGGGVLTFSRGQWSEFVASLQERP
ncbi:DUF397 domain-containing protein [Saccharopolyspora rosea]|uniref:DUF397 domain-containing protein n=1 Tax=Saccharopolyspora rosea TaxID=524884 RepID=A0ABW3FLI9_9PSEU|nr:DUF397 domain-containing protein [Saccharopolyspora rosea]